MYVIYYRMPNSGYGYKQITAEYGKWLQFMDEYILSIFMVPGTLDHELGE